MIDKEYHRVCDPIPTEHFKFFLNRIVGSLERKKASKLSERGKVLIHHYNVYVTYLCGFVIDKVHGNNDYLKEVSLQREALNKKMMEFRRLCSDPKQPGDNYCLT